MNFSTELQMIMCDVQTDYRYAAIAMHKLISTDISLRTFKFPANDLD